VKRTLKKVINHALIRLKIDIKELDKLKLIENYEITRYSFDVDYNYWSTEQILYSVMPEGDAETPSSFTTTGHIGTLFAFSFIV
jgi:tRNA (guanine37-N1)-methyltransferase